MPAAVTPAEARRFWTYFEPIHAVTYFCPQPRAAFEALDPAARAAHLVRGGVITD